MREDPSAVVDLPHALPYLLTEENLARNVEELEVRSLAQAAPRLQPRRSWRRVGVAWPLRFVCPAGGAGAGAHRRCCNGRPCRP